MNKKIQNILRATFVYKLYAGFRIISKLEREQKEKRKQEELFKRSPEYIQFLRCEPWFRDAGDETLRINYPLDSSSIVFDVGGYKGEFASIMHNKYDCSIYIFEPVPEFYEIIKSKFSNNNRVKSFCFGLSAKNESHAISLLDNSSSIYANNGESEQIQITLFDIKEFLKRENLNSVDLIKINIEGGEYELLETLLLNNLISIFKNIQVQFHDFVIENAAERMKRIQNKLMETHKLTYQYEFVWENWTLK